MSNDDTQPEQPSTEDPTLTAEQPPAGRGTSLLLEVAEFMHDVGGTFEQATAGHIAEVVETHRMEKSYDCGGCWDSQEREWPCWHWLAANELALTWLLERVKSGGGT